MLGAMIAAMSVQWTVSRAVANGLITDHLAFARTSKGGLSRMSIEFQAFWEAVIGVLLLVGAAVLVVTNGSSRSARSTSSPACWCWRACRSCRRSRSRSWRIRGFNSFAFWRNSAVRAAELIGLRPVALPQIATPRQPVASEVRHDS